MTSERADELGDAFAFVELDRLGSVAAEADASLCLDVGYAYLEAGVDGLDRFLASYGDLVAHLHVHDARRRGDTHVPLGSGDVEIDAVVTRSSSSTRARPRPAGPGHGA